MSKLSKFNISLVFVVCLLCVLFCGTSLADGAKNDVSYTESPIYIDGLLSCRGYEIDDVIYLPLESTCTILGYEPKADFNNETNTLTVTVGDIEISVCRNDKYICANERYLYLPDGYMEIEGSAVIPVDALAKIFTLSVSWSEDLGAYNLDTANKALLTSGEEFYNDDDLYWMSRIITAEAGNQPIEGQIGVGNVVMNRVESKSFANTIKGVIFQPGQFTPASSGSVYMDPFKCATISAKLVLEGYNTVGKALYFRQGHYGGDWTANNARFVMNIADHNFYI